MRKEITKKEFAKTVSFNYFYNNVPIQRAQFVESVPSSWENEINEYGEYSYGYYRAVEK